MPAKIAQISRPRQERHKCKHKSSLSAPSPIAILGACLVGVSLLGACDQHQKEESPAAKNTIQAAAKAPIPPPEPPPWFLGEWKAKSKTTLLPATLELDKEERKKKPSSANKKKAAGTEKISDQDSKGGLPFEIEVKIDKEFVVSGTAKLGTTELQVSGTLDGEVLRITLIAPWTRGTLVAKKEGELLKGQVRLSETESTKNGASLGAYQGPVSLRLDR